MKRNFRMISLAIAICMLLSLGMAPASAESWTPLYSAADLFSSRDLQQTADLAGAVSYSLSDGQDIHITAAGVYALTGSAANATVYVEAGKDDKVQLVLNGVNVTNADFPVIDVKTADKVFITVSGDSSLSVTGAFRADGSGETDAVIFSKTDLTLSGTATLTISSSASGISGKDDLKITGGTYMIAAQSKAIDANDSIRIADGTLNLTAGTDGLHAENSDDAEKGYIYIGGGSITINAGDDGVHGSSAVQMDGGTLSIKAAEGIEGSYIQLNGGTLSIQAVDDGINAARKSSAYTPTVEINGGDISVVMASGDTDGIDSNGNIIVNGGTVSVTGSNTFDYDGTAQYNGGVIIVNGQQTASIPNQLMGGGRGGFGGFENSGWNNGGFDRSSANGWGRGGRGGFGGF